MHPTLSVDPAAAVGSVDAAAARPWDDRLARRTRGRDGTLSAILALANVSGVINFSGGFPDHSIFPTEALHRLTDKLLHDDAAVALQYAPSEGIASTRELLRDQLARTQGIRPAESELMITSGGIDAITLIAKSMLDPGDTVLVEQPSYVGAVTGFATFDARVVGVPIDEQGLDVEALARLLASGERPKVLYVIPDHQNPTGWTLIEERRRALVEICRRHGVLIVEDVAYRELGFAESPAPSLWSLAPDTVVQIGTFSKTFFPGVRLGWAAGPAEVVEQMVFAKQNSDQCAGALGQRLLEEFVRGGYYDDQVAGARRLYRRRAAVMTEALTASFGDSRATWSEPDGGFFCWVRLPGVDTVELAARARDAHVAFVPGAGFFVGGGDTEHLRLSYSRVADADIPEGISRLAAAARLASG
ncbi:MAG: PLP-dependent aminotransferase family protein [Jatrophihabitans sp.]|uniref:aminotransferase-like domain-containing protein n=1 Tax=Jatrophihabitans sp. TaxID=1932789 RepID=UPI0039116E5E